MENKTRFASPLRSTRVETEASLALITSHEFLGQIFGAINSIGAILDKNRQVVYANDEFLSYMGFASLESLLGKRPGEAISCIHSSEELSGCGTSEACSVCGAVNTILQSQLTQAKVSRETRITSFSNGTVSNWDLKVTCSPIILSKETFYIFTVEDISVEKQKQALERIFFHDVLNLAGGLSGLLSVMRDETNPDEIYDLISKSQEASQNLIEEINLQRQMKDAERGDLVPYFEVLESKAFLFSAVSKIKFHETASGKKIIIDSDSVDVQFSSDKILLQRVLINILKNALEATARGGIVTIGCAISEKGIKFQVHNDGFIPRDVQLQIFQRSYSTKGSGRGMGTYSMKLLTEKYLGGKVGFTTDEKEGTVFYIELPNIKRD